MQLFETTVKCFCFPWYLKGISGKFFFDLWSESMQDQGKSFGNF